MRCMLSAEAAVALVLVALLFVAAQAGDFGNWNSGRATHYVSGLINVFISMMVPCSCSRRSVPEPVLFTMLLLMMPSAAFMTNTIPAASQFLSNLQGTDAWSIHKGSCGYGWLDRDVMTGVLLGTAVPLLGAAVCACCWQL
jgi:hypothetical protein